jgi:hypothetical protein
MKRRTVLGSAIALLLLVAVPVYVRADDSYSNGTYSACQYNACGISLTSSGTVDLSVIPGASTTCTVQSDSVAVTTDSSTGYTLTLNDGDTSNQMPGSNGGAINAVSGTNAAPATLGANTWGYRVDGNGGFGAGPTSASSNGSVPAGAFAAVPLSSAAPDTIATSSVAADPAVTTPVWYGLCANAAVPNGNYSDSVVYTAVVN